MVFHGGQTRALPLDYGIWIVNRGLILGMLAEVLIQLDPGEIVRIPFAAGRHGHFAEEEVVVIDQVPPAAHDAQQALQGCVARGLVYLETAIIALPPIDAVQQLAGLDELFDHAALTRGESLAMERHLDRLPAG